jgi:hypothetical protein
MQEGRAQVMLTAIVEPVDKERAVLSGVLFLSSEEIGRWD